MQIKTIEDYNAAYKKSIEHPETFWAEIAEEFSWKQKWENVLMWNFSDYNVRWFLNGKLNITENCLDRHLEKRGNQAAIIWEPNDPNEKSRAISYKELHEEVCRF